MFKMTCVSVYGPSTRVVCIEPTVKLQGWLRLNEADLDATDVKKHMDQQPTCQSSPSYLWTRKSSLEVAPTTLAA